MFIFLDTETSGSGPTDRLCQIAFKTDAGTTVNEPFNPGMPISLDATHHTALGDVLVTEALLKRIHAKFKDMSEYPMADMNKISSGPVLVTRMPFVKQKGLKMPDVPGDYLEWLSGTNLDEDLAYTVRHYLGGSSQKMD